MLDETPIPEKSFADSIGLLRSVVASDAERAMGSNRKTVEVENSRHYPAPSLRADRNQRFPLGASDLYHAVNARFERLPLDPEDDANAVALVANLSGIEYLGRMTGYKPDEAVFAEKATHFSPDQLGKLITNIGSDAARIKRSSPGLTQLQQAASEARQSVRSLVLVKDHALLTEAEKAAALNEEVNHALQRAVTGASLTDFLGKNAQPFMADPLASLAQQNLEQMGYKFRSQGHAAAEVGVRLMYRDAYRELGLSPDESRALGTQYVQRLKKEYGHAKADRIARRVSEALP